MADEFKGTAGYTSLTKSTDCIGLTIVTATIRTTTTSATTATSTDLYQSL